MELAARKRRASQKRKRTRRAWCLESWCKKTQSFDCTASAPTKTKMRTTDKWWWLKRRWRLLRSSTSTSRRNSCSSRNWKTNPKSITSRRSIANAATNSSDGTTARMTTARNPVWDRKRKSASVNSISIKTEESENKRNLSIKLRFSPMISQWRNLRLTKLGHSNNSKRRRKNASSKHKLIFLICERTNRRFSSTKCPKKEKNSCRKRKAESRNRRILTAQLSLRTEVAHLRLISQQPSPVKFITSTSTPPRNRIIRYSEKISSIYSIPIYSAPSEFLLI